MRSGQNVGPDLGPNCLKHSIIRFSRLFSPSSGLFRDETKGYGVRETTRIVSFFFTSTHGPAKSKFLTKFLFRAEMQCLFKKKTAVYVNFSKTIIQRRTGSKFI